MRDEVLSLLELFFKIEERGGQATLAVTTDSGKTKIKFEVASPSTTFGTGSSPSMPTSSAAPQPAPGKRKRSGAARRKAKLRAAVTRPPWQLLLVLYSFRHPLRRHLLHLLHAHPAHFTTFCPHHHPADGAGSCPWEDQRC